MTSALLMLQAGEGQAASTSRTLEAPIVQVTLFLDGARMTRYTEITLPEGRSRVQFEVTEGELANASNELTEGLSASAGDGMEVLSIELIESVRRVAAPKVAELTERLDALDTELASAIQLVENAQADLKILEVFGERIVEGTGSVPGTAPLNIEEFDRQLEFISNKRLTILQSREVAEKSASALEKQRNELAEELVRMKDGVPVIMADLLVESTGSASNLAFTWFELGAHWSPEFMIRTDRETASATVDVSAMIHNETKNDWNDVELVLSTAEAALLLAPRSVEPVVVDVARAAPKINESPDSRALFGAPSVTNVGPTTTYTLKEKISLLDKTNKRILVEQFQTTCTLQVLARPIVAPGAFLRGTIRNAPKLVLLPGTASLFIDGTFVGQTDLEQVAPGADFEVWYGELPGIKVERTILQRETVKTGLLGGGRLTRTQYRIAIQNGRPDPLDVIIEDRLPVSQSGDIEVSLKNMSPALSTNAAYLENQRPLGILRWDVSLPAGGPDSEPVNIDWTVNVSRSSEVDITPIPE